MSNETYQLKLDQATALIDKHNAKAAKKVDATQFIECLQNNGATSDEALSFCKYEDLVSCGLPVIIARQVVETVFRGKASAPVETTAKPETSRYVSEKKALAMTFKELVERYDPVEHDNPVGKRLADLSKGNPCIAFNADGSVNVEVSAKEVKSLRDGLEARDHAKVNGIPVKLFKVGDRPGNFLDENPLYPGRPLRDGECDQLGRSWEGVADTVKTILYLAVSRTDELRINQLKDAHDTLDMVLNKDAISSEVIVRQRFPQASLMFDDLKTENKLPSLKIARGTVSGRKQDPFYNNHKTY